MFYKRIYFILLVSLCSITLHCKADTTKYPMYIGLTGGYGSTTWQGLVSTRNNETDAIIISTPKNVTEGGAIWGVFAGYEFTPFFALEGNYTHYPDAKVTFDPLSLVAFNYNGLIDLNTETESVSLMAKILMSIPRTYFRVYSSAGIADIHRNDQLKNSWQISPSFGVGVHYNFSERILFEAGVNYTAGYGESELDPAEDYVPFLYSGFLRVAYRW